MTQSILQRHSHWHRLRWQLLWGAVAACIPFVMRMVFFGISYSSKEIALLINGVGAGLAAILLGIFLIRNVGRYPGVEKTSAIIPGFSVSFGALVVVLLMMRLDYSRWMLAGSYLSAIFLFYIGYAQVFARKQLAIGVIASEDETSRLHAIEGVEWIPLERPDQEIDGLEAIAADLRRDLPIKWEQRIADFALLGIPVYHDKHLIESLTGRVELEHISETSFGTLSPPSVYMLPKHALDRVCAMLALLLLGPLLLIIALLVRLDSPGPAIFRQERIGFRGQRFTVYKFRTMCASASGGLNAISDAITVSNDSRITRLGRVLRRVRIDELPQILNVVKGEMSWIGPRPEAAVLSSWYEAEIPFYRYRHIVRPGITGWAQVMQGHVAEVENVQDKLYYDFYYIKNFSLWIDILIFIRTLGTVATGFGAK